MDATTSFGLSQCAYVLYITHCDVGTVHPHRDIWRLRQRASVRLAFDSSPKSLVGDARPNMIDHACRALMIALIGVRVVLIRGRLVCQCTVCVLFIVLL